MTQTETEALDAGTNTTSMKRKIDEAFDALDDALQPKERPSPPKRANTSIYGALAKYGLRTFNKPSNSKLTLTPTLAALLSRSRSKKQHKPLVVPQSWKSSSVTPDYSPSSTEAFLQRLSTFSLSTYTSKPPQIDAVAACKAGWVNEGGKDRLYCSLCGVGWVVAGREGMKRDAGNLLVEKQRKSLVEMHKEGCPWRVRQCDPMIYRIPLQSPTGLARQIRSLAAELEPVLDGISIRHPLSSTQVQSLVQTISFVPLADTTSIFSPPPGSAAEETGQNHSSLPSTNSVLTSLFGWCLVPIPSPIPRKSSLASLPVSPAHSRALSIVGPSRESTPAPGAIRTPALFNTPVRENGPFPGNSYSDNNRVESPNTVLSHREPSQKKDTMLQCRMCRRRVGLWAFAVPISSPDTTQNSSTSSPQRHFDILREHRSYCPYVVKSTPLPSMPSYPAPPPTSSPRSSFNLTRAGTSLSMTEAQSSSSTFNLRRTASLLSGATSLARAGTISSSTPSAHAEFSHTIVEGWRAVLSVVLRYGIAERSRMRTLPPNSAPTSAPAAAPVPEVVEKDDDDDAMSGVVALVDGVKQHGGKQLLSYVRSLLG